MPDRFLESGTKNAPEYKCLYEAWKQPSDTISCENNFITSTIFVVFCQAIDQPQCKVRGPFVSDTMFIRETERYGLYRIHFRITC